MQHLTLLNVDVVDPILESSKVLTFCSIVASCAQNNYLQF
jgi:hypothetical protein